MIVPSYWAEATLKHRDHKRQVSVRRFGWSDTSQADAQALADARAREALERLQAGESLVRREPRIAYNGAQGVPIREEILAREGDAIVTRNAYGAHCLNTPNVLFVDIDFDPRDSLGAILKVAAVAAALAALAGWLLQSWQMGVILGFLGVSLSGVALKYLHRAAKASQGGAERAARKRIERFLAAHPGWGFRLYRTPAGLRALATHRTFDPADPEVMRCFAALDADPVYVRMCLNQHCFRARLSAKPWRIGIGEHMRPRPGVWPVAPDRMARRQAWVAKYEAAAKAYAACMLLDSVGSRQTHPDVARVQRLHDELCRATSGLPIA
ncbi:MAG TPA: hypothetical protein PLX20_04410 [Rhodocyclaceae bacterium]|nr:hypothetical protein [Rhodocyclaceae bacterium]HMV55094.1 hypothetical protein [Rhodocyclaceae bacterium]HMZ84966.1 hypothetical protein [Rhodocyclaceae bacterium]HNA04774.1 hypothetical protein [Rhodocyclaceae bacterium]HNB77569.1 hypothetical protein [Rhodocyclaceae bacterium]